MTKDEVIQVIKENILDNLEDINESDIDPNKSMKDLGANSLDIIEVVSTSMRQLNIKIPRTELADIQTIGQLADKFLEHLSNN
jgi:acyl carrier protein